MMELFANNSMFAEGWLSIIGSFIAAGMIFHFVKGWPGARLAIFWLLWQVSMPVLPVLEGGLMLISGMVLSESLYRVCTRQLATTRPPR